MPNSFSRERARWRADKNVLLQSHRGQFAVYDGDDRLGITHTLDEAVGLGLKRTGRTAFFVQRIDDREPAGVVPAFAF